MQEKLEREKLNGQKDVAQSNYNTETTAYNQVLLARLLLALLRVCSAWRACVPSAQRAQQKREAARAPSA